MCRKRKVCVDDDPVGGEIGKEHVAFISIARNSQVFRSHFRADAVQNFVNVHILL